MVSERRTVRSGVSSTSNPIDDAQFFVLQQYLTFEPQPDPQESKPLDQSNPVVW